MTFDTIVVLVFGAICIVKIICNTIIELKQNNTDEDEG